jgi:hypothetical protein
MISQNLISMELTLSTLRATVSSTAEVTQGQPNAAKLGSNAANRTGTPAQAYTPERSEGVEETDRSNVTFGKIHSINSSRMSLATSIRTVDQTMEAISNHIDKMEAPLHTIVKNFPPFPPGSEERAKLLQSYTSFRKLIEQLTYPPDDKVATKIMGQSTDELPAGGLNVAFVDENFDRVVRDQEIHIGIEGLNIPELSEDSSDGEVARALPELEAARQKLAEKRAQLAADTLGVNRLAEQNAQRGKIYESIVAQRGKFSEESVNSGEVLYSTLVEQRQAARSRREQSELDENIATERLPLTVEGGAGMIYEKMEATSSRAGSENSTGELYDLIVSQRKHAEEQLEANYEQVSHEVKESLSDQTLPGLSGNQGFFLRALS